MSESLRLTRAAELESLPAFREFIAAAGRRAGLADDVVYDLQLAVDEACTNVITHGYAGMDPGSIILELALQPGRAVLTLTDFGHPFEPSQAPQPDVSAALEDRPTGGLGLYFIYSVMDLVDYQAGEDGNRLSLVRRLAA